MIFGLYYKTALLLFFFTQGMILSLVLLAKGVQGDKTNFWLSALIFLACLYVGPWMFGHADWYAKDGYREFLFFMPFQQFFLIGPILYIYCRLVIGLPYPKRLWLHFMPALLYLMYSLMVFVVDYFLLEDFYFYADGRDKDLDPWYQLTGLLFVTLYVAQAAKEFNTYRSRIVNEVSFADSVKFSWLRRFLLSFLAILVVRVLFFVLFPEWGAFGLKWWYYLIFAGIFYYISFAGYAHSIKTGSFTRSMLFQPSILETDDGEATNELTTDQVKELKDRIAQLFQEKKVFRNPGLTLSQVAEAIGTNTRVVSQVINRGFDKNFNDYVNEYRIQEVKDRISQGDHQKFSLLGLAYDSGFNSKSTFNRVFKKLTGNTPNTFIEQVSK